MFIGKAVQSLTEYVDNNNDVNKDKIFTNIIIYCSLALSAKVCRELQNVVYLRVKQLAYTEIAEITFNHLHSLSLEWHLKKKNGKCIKING